MCDDDNQKLRIYSDEDLEHLDSRDKVLEHCRQIFKMACNTIAKKDGEVTDAIRAAAGVTNPIAFVGMLDCLGVEIDDDFVDAMDMAIWVRRVFLRMDDEDMMDGGQCSRLIGRLRKR